MKARQSFANRSVVSDSDGKDPRVAMKTYGRRSDIPKNVGVTIVVGGEVRRRESAVRG